MLSKSWTILHIRGIPIRLHISLLLVLPLLTWSVATNSLPSLLHMARVPEEALTLPPTLLGAFVAVALFAGIALHELGHALVALRQGGEVRSITLMVLGGVAQMDHDHATPWQQAWMAFAGPLVSFVLGAVSLVLAGIDSLVLDLRASLYIFGGMNLALAVFNLLPAYPLDGGRILRAMLNLRLPAAQATRVAATVGRGLAIVGLAIGVMRHDPMLLLVSVFVFFGASADEAATTLRLGLNGLRARQAMATRVASVEPQRSLPAVARHMLFLGASAALVRDLDGVRGVLTVRDLQSGDGRTAGERVRGKPLWVNVDDDLTEVVGLIQKSPQNAAIVVDDMNTILGVVTYEDLARAVALRGVAESGGAVFTPPGARPALSARSAGRKDANS